MHIPALVYFNYPYSRCILEEDWLRRSGVLTIVKKCVIIQFFSFQTIANCQTTLYSIDICSQTVFVLYEASSELAETNVHWYLSCVWVLSFTWHCTTWQCNLMQFE